MQLEFGAQADAEVLEATVWYLVSEGGEALALRFATEIERISALTAENPRLWPEIEPGVRRGLLHGFPYALIYTIETDCVFVLALAHQRQRYGYWRERVPR